MHELLFMGPALAWFIRALFREQIIMPKWVVYRYIVTTRVPTTPAFRSVS